MQALTGLSGLSGSVNAGIATPLRETFATTAAAPLSSPRTCEGGPGQLILTQTDGQFSISGGKLAFPAQTTPAWGDLSLYSSQAFPWIGGMAVMGTVNLASGQFCMIGWDADQSGLLSEGIYFSTSPGLAAWVSGSAAVTVGSWATATDYDVAIIRRASGGTFCLIKGGAFTTWTLIWVDKTAASAPRYAGLVNYQGVGTLDNFRVVHLGDVWGSDYGIATQRLAGARTAGDTLTHATNALVEFTVPTRPSSGNVEVRLWVQDSSNYWRVRVNSAGDLTLAEVVAGVGTVRITSSGAVAAGNRVAVIRSGTTFRLVCADFLRGTYSSASNFQTATAGELNSLGTGGAVSEIIAWPRDVSAYIPAGA